MQNNKDYLDQSLDEIKLLKYVNQRDPRDEHGILQLYDYFYYKVICALRNQKLHHSCNHITQCLQVSAFLGNARIASWGGKCQTAMLETIDPETSLLVPSIKQNNYEAAAILKRFAPALCIRRIFWHTQID